MEKATGMIFMEALYRAGMKEDARIFGIENGLEKWTDELNSSNLVEIRQVKAFAIPDIVTMLLGAYYASGNTDYIKFILENFTDASDDMVHDAFRLAFMNGRFGPSGMPPGRRAQNLDIICKKYNCEKNPSEFGRVITLSTGLWLVSSVPKSDQKLHFTMYEYFKGNQRLDKIFIVEKLTFEKYKWVLNLFEKNKNDPEVDSALTKFENLEHFITAAEALHKVKEEYEKKVQ